MILNYKKFNESNVNIDEIYFGQGYDNIKNEIINLDCEYYCQIKKNNKFFTIGSIRISPYYHSSKKYDDKNMEVSEILLSHFEINEKYRSKGYGERFLRMIIDKLKEWNI